MLRPNKLLSLAAATVLVTNIALAQSNNTTENNTQTRNAPSNILTQKARGIVTDAESKQPMPGVVVVLSSNTQLNAITDEKGFFTIDKIPVGRQSFLFSMVGFETYTAAEVMVISGKELELNVAMVESLHKLDEVTIKASNNRTRPLNEFASISARSFSVEETRRYAASIADPARMVMNFPGVTNSGDDNSIVVRGNSPKGVLWRLEGIEIPNPNHFSSLGSSGGSISMLNANVLGNSDFYTGAFVPEIGNALSGAFDLNFRNGNAERYEHTVQVGVLGVELATEGPFKQGKKASYLINYRYSTFALLENFLDLGGILPNYQDGSLKLNFPTEKAGTFTVFGLGGYNISSRKADADSTKWNEEGDDLGNFSFKDKNHMFVGGVSHQYFLNKDAYIKTVVSGSTDKNIADADTLNPYTQYMSIPVEHRAFSNNAIRASVLYNQKLNARHTFRTGVIAQQLGYDMNYSYYKDSEKEWKSILSGDGSTQYYQAYLQWKTRITEKLSMVSGVHGSYYALNSKYSIEPRASLSYQLNKNKFTLAAGLHSKPEHISTYLYQNLNLDQNATHPNKDLDLLRALHTVAGYERALPGNMRMKIEAYYQRLYNIPVEKDTASGFSILNAEDIFSLMATKQQLVSDGKGTNYGVDISLERPFGNGYYILTSGSVYKSTYTNYNGDEYNTRFNRGYTVNFTGGKEFKLTTNGRKLVGVNAKVQYSGGTCESPVDFAKSKAQEETVYVPRKFFSDKGPDYFRADLGLYYKVNNKKATHSIQLDVINATSHTNYYSPYYNVDDNEIKREKMLGIIPNLSYRIDFHW
jgi:hypothetical protein